MTGIMLHNYISFIFIIYKHAYRVKLFDLEVQSLKEYRNKNTENINVLVNIRTDEILATTEPVRTMGVDKELILRINHIELYMNAIEV